MVVAAPALAFLLTAASIAPALAPPVATPSDPFAMAEQVLQARLAGPGPTAHLEQQLRNLAATQRLLAILDAPTPSLQQTIDLARALGAAQMEALDRPASPSVPPAHESPSTALRELAARHGLLLTSAQSHELAQLDALPASLRHALASFVAAFLGLEEASRDALAGSTPPVVTLQLTSGPPAGAQSGIGFDAAQLLAARAAFLATLPALDSALQETQATRGHTATVSVAPIFSIDLDTDNDVLGAAEPFVLVVDAGGDDRYHNNAGGNNLAATCAAPLGFLVPAAALVDLGGGTDSYGDPLDPGSCGVTGGGFQGVGLLVDGGGADHYAGFESGVNGGGVAGVGLVADAGGDDLYSAGVNVACSNCSPGSRGVNGGALRGIGGIVDLAGHDRYHAGVSVQCQSCEAGAGGVNGGAVNGIAALLDGAGRDDHLAGVDVVCSNGCAAGSNANGGAIGGVALLVNAGIRDPDVYQAGVRVTCSGSSCIAGTGQTNGGANQAAATLFDAGGNDRYESGEDIDFLCQDADAATFSCHAGTGGTNGGGYFGSGLLLDFVGDDHYLSGTNSSVLCSGSNTALRPFAGIGVGSLGVNGGGFAGHGLLIDGAGRDTYHAGTGSTLACPGYTFLTLALVPDGPVGRGMFGVNGGTGSLADVGAANLDADWWPGAGLLLDDGDFGDAYDDNEGGTGTDKTVIPKGTLGAQVDCEGTLSTSCL